MSTEEKIYVWKPAENLAGKFYMISVSIDLDGFRVVLKRENAPQKSIVVDFFAGVRSYRVTDELLAMHLLEGEVLPTKESLSLEGNLWSFFEIKNSDYLQWASYQSDGVSENLGLAHYVIWTEDWCIDILSCGNPEIRQIDLRESA